MNVKAITAPVAKAIKAPIEASAKKAEPYFFRGDAAMGQTTIPSSRVKFMDMELDCNKYYGAGSFKASGRKLIKSSAITEYSVSFFLAISPHNPCK